MRFWAFVVIFAAWSQCSTASEITKVAFPTEVRQEVRTPIDPELQGLQWNRWTSDNFVVCATNDQQARFLNSHLEQVKEWALARWGLEDVKFSAECILLCVDDPAIFKKFFNIDSTKVEVRRDTNGKINRSVIFLLGNKVPSETIPVPLMDVCLSEFEQAKNVKFGFWAHRGMSELNGSLPSIRQAMGDLAPLLAQNQPMFFSKALLTATPEQYEALGSQKRIFDMNATALCLMLRKEFGQDKFHQFLAFGGNYEAGLKQVYGFQGFDHFDQAFKRFMIDVAAGATGSQPGREVTPDEYLEIREKG